jgi:glycosyltransferase involved in cell wall biosynthesis
VPYRRDPRFAGETKWNYWKLWNFALEGITSFSIAPLKAATYVGLLVAGSAFLFAFLILVKTLLFGDIIRGYPTIMVTLLFLGGTQLIAIGVLGEYVGRMFNETKNRPLYFIDEHRKAPAVPLRHTETAASLTTSEVC